MNSNLYLLAKAENDLLNSPQEDLTKLFHGLPDSGRYSIKASLRSLVYPKHLSLETINSSPHYIADTASSALDLAHFLGKRNCFPPFSSIICRSQSKGRGQLQRAWSSESGNIYASLSLPNIYPFSTGLASPLIGALLVKALAKLGYKVKLKWPNDLVQQSEDGSWKKVAGILLEEKGNNLVAGIGINLSKAPSLENLRSEHFIAAGILSKCSKTTNTFPDEIFFNQLAQKNNLSNKLQITKQTENYNMDNVNNFNKLPCNFLKIWQFWLSLVDEIFLCYRELLFVKDENRFSDFIENIMAFKGEKMKIIHPIVKESLSNQQIDLDTDYIKGIICGVNSEGELLLQIDDEIITVLGGSFTQG